MLDRFILFIFGLAGATAAAVLCLIGFVWVDEEGIAEWLELAGTQIGFRILFASVGFLWFLAGLRFVYMAVRPERRSTTIDQRNDYGDIRISLDTVESIALGAAEGVRGTKEVRTRVSLEAKGLEIMVKTFTEAGQSIPELTESVQKRVKEDVERLSGIPVGAVSVFVANVVGPPAMKSRVE